MNSRNYKSLTKNAYSSGRYKLVALRDEDKYAIMQWRNEQIDILRQKSILTKEQQENYFANVVSKLFEQEFPTQILFSFFEDDKLIGYGGLVHIDWESRLAEISFLTETSRNKSKEQFVSDWTNYLHLLKGIAKDELKFQKIFTYAYDIRPQLYEALFLSGFTEEARLTDHIIINGQKRDVLIHSCFLEKLVWRFANTSDVELYFDWANDDLVRSNSFVQQKITHEDHVAWFNRKLNSSSCKFYLFIKNGEPAGQVRIDLAGNEVVIGVSVDKAYRGMGLSSKMIEQASDHYLQNNTNNEIIAYIKEENKASYKSFRQAGFVDLEITDVNGMRSYKLIKKTP